MFYEKQSKEEQEAYKKMLAILGSLSNLFSDSKDPMLYYRAHENCFCKYFNADNLGRFDCSADASKCHIGIGLKTWVGGNIQKVAEFGKLKQTLDKLNDDELVVKIAEYRNARIRTTLKMYGLSKLIYHVVIRTINMMKIYECSFDLIDLQHIKRLPNKDRANTRYFTDGKHIYHFNKAKTTLYMNFDDLSLLDTIPVKIIDDPFSYLERVAPFKSALLEPVGKPEYRKLALKLFKKSGDHYFLEEKSGLNIWNAGGRKRHPDEVYIPFNMKERLKPQNRDFFPSGDTCFDLLLPDGTHISAKLCQQDDKAIMSNPNKALGKWLLRDVLEIPEGTIVTYELLQEKGFDTVVFEKYDDLHFKIDFTTSDAYDALYANVYS